MIEKMIDEMDLRGNGDNLTGDYSGGNKRKMMVAISTIADPKVVFLDEPSTGMDPKTRRLMWEVIKGMKLRNCSIILTTHSMEEAEALADRITVMKKVGESGGAMRCIGYPQALKNKFGKGVYVGIKFNYVSESQLNVHINEIQSFIRK